MNKLPIVKRGYQGGIDFQDGNRIGSGAFLYLYAFGIFIFLLFLALRLFQLTVVKGEYYRRLAEENRIRDVIIEPKRGTIIDRKGIVIAQNNDVDLHASGERLPSSRHYYDAEAVAPLIGYRQIADKADVEHDPCLAKISSGDKVGKKGVEKVYECELRGRNGKKLLEVDAHGKPITTLSVISPENGKTVQLAADSVLQKKAYDLIKDKRAAVVALQPMTGEVLVLASSPTFNPQDFENGEAKKISNYFTNKEKPLFNRVTEGTYPPGSVFKMVVAVGALEEKKIDESTIIEDTGKIKAGPIEFGNWYFLQYGKTDGPVNITKALQRSNDIYFYKVGERLGADEIKRWAEKFGYGQSTGIQLEEADGLIPSEFWKEEVLKENWYLGDTYNFSIGQGYMLVTPLQVAQATAVIANNGALCKPKLLKTNSPHGMTNPADTQPECTKLGLNQKTLDLVKQGMTEACTVGGTGWPLFEFTANRQRIQVACKTGTAESHEKSKIPHAWFTAYAPSQNPEIVVTVLVEESGQGSDIAAPIAKEVLSSYFERKE